MSHEPSSTGEPSTARVDLRNKPQRRSQWHPFSVLLLFGCLLVIGAGTLVVWQLVAHHGKPAPSKLQSTAPTQPPIVKIDCNHYPASYDDTLRQTLALELNLTLAQVTAQIRAGKSIQDVAATQNVSADRLAGLERYAYKTTEGPLVQGGCMSSDTLYKHTHESDTDLNHDFTVLFS